MVLFAGNDMCPYLRELEAFSRGRAIQIHVYFILYFTLSSRFRGFPSNYFVVKLATPKLTHSATDKRSTADS